MRVVITGGSSGLGKAIVDKMDEGINDVIDWSRETGVDISSPDDIKDAAEELQGKIDVLINCAGINEIDWLENLQLSVWDKLMNTNARAIFLVTQALLEKLRGGTILNIVSNASHIPMTCSLAYNASKAAAAIMTKQLARELGKSHDITVFAISPNKLKGTGMSNYIDKRVQETRGWTAEQARAYQLAALPAGEETDPNVLAGLIAYLLKEKERHKYLAGCDLQCGGP